MDFDRSTNGNKIIIIIIINLALFKTEMLDGAKL